MRKIISMLLTVLLAVGALAQTKTKTVKGVVYEEETGQTLPGATVSVVGSTRGVIADLDGAFEISGVKSTDELKVEFFGKEPVTIRVGDGTNFLVKLKNQATELEGAVTVAFGKQRKESLIGSVTAIDVATLKVPSSNLTTALAGNVAGVIAYQRTGEPGQDNADFFVRGITTFGANTSPLILIDNIELTSTDLARLQPDDIESFSIMKDATATALYGARGANGVIYVTTKRGQEGPAKIFARVETSISQPTRMVELADPVTYMKAYNEGISTRDPLAELQYSFDKIEQTGKPGANRLIYPANDWYDMLFKNFATAYRANISARGGGKVARYYVTGSFTEDTGILKVDKRNSFNNNIDQKTYTLRSNVDINVTKTTQLAVRLTGNFTDYTGPLNGGNDVFKQVVHSDPVLFPAYYPIDAEHVGIQHIMFGNYDDGSYTNPYANLVRGYRDTQRSQMIAAVELNQDLSFITPGLKFMTLFNLTRLSYYEVNRHFSPFWYTLDSYDSYTGEYHVKRINDNGTDYLQYSEKDKTITNTMYSESRLNYAREFGKNEVTGLLVLTAREQLNANAGSLQLSLPSRNAGLSGRFTYGWDKRYFAEFNFGYNGSERFHKSHRWGFFPSFGGAWVISNEPWFKKIKDKYVHNLKLRASYGLVGNDNIGNARNRFYYLSEMDMNSSNLQATFGEFRGITYKGIDVIRYANEAITWETSYKANYAVELGLFKKLDVIAEFFTEHRKDIFMSRADIPETMGLQAGISANIGEAKAHGIDIQADYKHVINQDMWASARANFTYSRSKYLVYEEPEYPEAYRQHAGHSLKQTWGYIAERLFIDDEEAANSPSQSSFGVQYGGGDIKYTDVNGDGVITEADRVPIGLPTSPEIIYGFGTSFGWKGLDFSVFFQGLANESFWIDATSSYTSTKVGTAPFVHNTQLLKAYYDSHWSEDNRDVYALWPRFSSSYENKNNSAVSTWWMRDGSFLRLKQLEIGYTLPYKWTKKLRMDNLRVYFQGNNLLCWSRFNLWDPELAGEGLNYPIQRTFNIGLHVTFK